MGHEVELKLEIAAGATDLVIQQPWFEGGRCSSQLQRSVYFDTSDGELRRRGYTLRVRSIGDRFVQTVKSLDSGAGLFSRGEWEYQVDGPEPEFERLAATPLADLDVLRLAPIIRSDVMRTACRLSQNGAEFELDVDQGIIFAGGHELPVSEVEIELLHGEADSAMALARRIADHVPVKLGVMSKPERGFALADGTLSKASKAGPVPVRAGMTVAEGFETIVTACIRHFRINEPVVIERRNMEALHQSRVAMRRLRSAISLFRPVIADGECGRIREELRWFTSQLGDARNLDVYLQRMLADQERETLQVRREAAYDLVIAAMESDRFRLLMLDLVAWAALGRWRDGEKAGGELAPFVRRRIDRLWHGICHANHLRTMDEQERHQLRIRAKKLRYGLEFVKALNADRREPRDEFAKQIEILQEELGLAHDIVSARSLVSTDEWPLVQHPASLEEVGHLRMAQRSLRKMRRIGRYWDD
jgi:triphosphatase